MPLHAPRLILKLCVLLFALLAHGAAQAQAVERNAAFHARVIKLYAFTPHTMTQEQVGAKVKELGGFWDEVKANQAKMLPWLRAELKDTSNPPYFGFDAGKLLMTLSKSLEDQAIALQALPRVDLRDADNVEYFLAVHYFSRHGLDTTQAALHMLDHHEFRANNAARGVNLDQAYAFLFCLLQNPESRFVPALAARLKTEKDPTAQKSLLLGLWYSVTKEGRAAIEAYVADRSHPEGGREYARRLLSETLQQRLRPTDATAEQVREERRKVLAKVEVLTFHHLDNLTAILISKGM